MGETVIGNGFMTASGGKGANQAVAAARLGANVSMLGAVGSDLFGADLKTNLESNNINTRFVKTSPKHPSGTAVILLHQGDNFIVIDPGANADLTPQDVTAAEEHIKKADMLIVQLEIPFETVTFTMKLAQNHGVRVLLNPAPASKSKVVEEIINMANILTPNETECKILSGLDVTNADSAFKALQYFMDRGVKQVCITMGEKGVAYNDGTEFKHIPCRDVEKVVDTTAAGDSFSAALAVALCKGMDINGAVRYANTAASLTVTKKGAQPSLPYAEAVALIFN